MCNHSEIPTLIDKEQIPNLSFPKVNICEKKAEELKFFYKKLKEAEILGNIHHSKVKIVFEDSDGLKEVRTTIWHSDKDFIVLKKGVFIPLSCVVRVVF